MPDIEELAVVDGITKWMAVNSEGIHGSRPWKIFGEGAPVQSSDQTKQAFNEGSRRAFDANDVRFTTHGDVLYAFVMGQPKFRTVIRSLATDTALRVGRITGVELVGSDKKITWSQDNSGLRIDIPDDLPSEHAVSFRVRGAI
jgi:alpha-L-fucosidase